MAGGLVGVAEARGLSESERSGHEQTLAVVVFLLIWLAAMGFGIHYRKKNKETVEFNHPSWYCNQFLQSFMAFTLPAA